MPHQDHKQSTGSSFADLIPRSALTRGTPGLSEGNSIERYQMPPSALDTHVLRQHCLSVGLGSHPVEYGGRLNGKQYSSIMKPDAVWFRAAGDSATCWWKNPMDGLFFSFDQDLIERTMWHHDHLQNFEFVSTLQSRQDSSLSHLIAALHFDTAEGHPYGVLRGEAILSAIVTLLVTGYGARTRQLVPERKDSPTVRRTMEYIAANLSAPLRVTAIAEAVGVSPSHLHRAFRTENGVSLWSYVLQERVRVSKELIRSSRSSLLEISLKMGFESYSQFVAAFRKHAQTTPREFRRCAVQRGGSAPSNFYLS
jgi:AraC-like DNA-binding protein